MTTQDTGTRFQVGDRVLIPATVIDPIPLSSGEGEFLMGKSIKVTPEHGWQPHWMPTSHAISAPPGVSMVAMTPERIAALEWLAGRIEAECEIRITGTDGRGAFEQRVNDGLTAGRDVLNAMLAEAKGEERIG